MALRGSPPAGDGFQLVHLCGVSLHSEIAHQHLRVTSSVSGNRALSWLVIVVACGTPTAATHELPRPAIIATVAPPPIDARIDAAPPDAEEPPPDPEQQKQAAMVARAAKLAVFPRPDVTPFGSAGDKVRGLELLAAARKTQTIDAYRAAVDADPSNADAYYALASAYANAGKPDIAIPLLAELAVAHHCSACNASKARFDDAWRNLWGTEGFRDVLAADATTRDDDPPPPPSSTIEVPALLSCPKGTRYRSKGHPEMAETGEEWCEKNGVKNGPYHEHIDGCSMGEGGCTTYGQFVDGKRDGEWISSGRYDPTVIGGYRADKKHGLWTTDGKSSMKYEIFVDDKQEDLAIQYEPDGTEDWERHYRAGVFDGHYIEYRSTTAIVDGNYAAGKKDGRWSYVSDDGKKLKDESWDHGVPDGVFTYYDSKGAMLATRSLVHGTGPWIEYDHDHVVATGAYLNGKKTGAWTESGDSGSYKAGERDGVWTRVDDQGAKLSEGAYVGGSRNGRWTYWTPDGTVLAKGSFDRGARSGTWTISDPEMAGAQVLVFRNGKLATVDGAPATGGQRVALRLLVNFDDKPAYVERLPDGATSASSR